MVTFWITALVLLLSAGGVLLSRNPMHSALWLILNLVGVAALYAQLDAHFLAAAQIIVYAGAIMVLVLFVLMLLNVKNEEVGRGEWLLSAAAVGAAIFFVCLGVPVLVEQFGGQEAVSGLFSGQRFEQSNLHGATVEVAKLLFTKYSYTIELGGMLLTAALIGAVMLAQERRRRSGPPGTAPQGQHAGPTVGQTAIELSDSRE